MPISEAPSVLSRLQGLLKRDSYRYSDIDDKNWLYTDRGSAGYEECFIPLLKRLGLERYELRTLIPVGGSYLDLMSYTSAARQMGARVSLCVAASDPRVEQLDGEVRKNIRRDHRQGIDLLVGKAQDEITWNELSSWKSRKTPNGFNLITEVGDGALDDMIFFPNTEEDFLTLVDRAYSVLAPGGIMLMQVSTAAESAVARLVDEINQRTNGALYADYENVRKSNVYGALKAVFVIQKRENAPLTLAEFKN